MIKVKTLTGKEIEIDIELTDTVERIKERVEEKMLSDYSGNFLQVIGAWPTGLRGSRGTRYHHTSSLPAI